MSLFYTPASFILIILLGFILKSTRWLGKDDALILTKILLNVTLPATIIIAFSKLSYSSEFFLIVLVGLTASCAPLLLWFCLSVKSDSESRLFSMINVSGFNIGCFALPFINSLIGDQAGAYAALFDTGNALMMTGGAFAIATSLLRINGNETGIIKSIAKQLAKSHLFILYILLTIFVALDITLPEPLLKLIEPIAQANAFVAMLIIGLMFTPQVGKKKLTLSLKIIFFRLINSAIFSILIYNYLPVSEAARQVLAIIVFSPISALAPLFTLKSKGDVELSSFTNNLSILVGLISMSVVSMIVL